MDRRNLLTHLALLPFIAANPWTVLATPNTPGNSLRYRPSGSGQLMVTMDDGKTWESSLNFGPEHQIVEINDRRAPTLLRIGYRGHIFFLESVDGLTWRPSLGRIF